MRGTRVRTYLVEGHCAARGRDNNILLGQEPIFMQIERDRDSPDVIGGLKIAAGEDCGFPKGENLHSLNSRCLLTRGLLSQILKS